MEQTVEMQARVRQERGKNAMRRLRRSGQIPAVLYGQGKEAIALSLESKSISRVVQLRSGHNQILNLHVDGGEDAAALAVDWQVDPLRSELLHVDLQRIDLEKPVEVSVPIATVGVPRGVKEQGGIEEIINREVEMECLPLEVPDRIEVDVSELLIGQTLRVRDLAASEKYKFLTDPDRALVHVVAPRVVEAVEAAPEEAAAEPEVAEKGKAEEEKEEPEKE